MLEGRERKATRESRVDLSEKTVVRKKGHASRRYSDVRSASIRFDSIRFRDMEAWEGKFEVLARRERGRGREVCDKKLADGVGCVYACSRE